MWKDFLYFPKNDRIAIVLLLILIIISGIFVLLAEKFIYNESETAQDELLIEFDKFQRGMLTIENIKPEINRETEGLPVGEPSLPSMVKLDSGETIDINNANVSNLKKIPGIGEGYAKRIVDYRKRLGGFVAFEQIKEIQGFSGKRYDNILPYIRIDKKPSLLKINQLEISELNKHPYISSQQAEFIMEFRNRQEKITGWDILLSGDIFTPRDKERLSGYISFE